MEMHSEAVFLRLRVRQEPAVDDLALLNLACSSDGFEAFTFRSLNSARLKVLPLPLLSSVRPAAVFNLAVVRSLKVTGENFEDSGPTLSCTFSAQPPSASSYTNRATFFAHNLIACPFDLPARMLQEP